MIIFNVLPQNYENSCKGWSEQVTEYPQPEQQKHAQPVFHSEQKQNLKGIFIWDRLRLVVMFVVLGPHLMILMIN